jgi:zinc protease
VNAAQPVARSPLAIAMAGAGQAGVAMAMPSIARAAPDYYAGQVANTVLGGGYSSRLSQEIRIKRGLSYDVQSRLEARRAGGTFSVLTQTKNASAPEVVTLMVDEVTRMGAAPPDADELAARKLALIGGFSRGLETTEDLAGNLAALEANGVDLAELGRVIGKMERVTANDVQAFAKAHWGVAALRIVVAGDAPQFIEGLRKTYPDLLVIPQADVDLEAPGLMKSTTK